MQTRRSAPLERDEKDQDMCKATKEGGQRCVGHATQAYVKRSQP